MNGSNQYLVLEDRGNGELYWNILQPIPIGAILEARDALDALVKRQVMGPAPMPVVEDVAEGND